MTIEGTNQELQRLDELAETYGLRLHELQKRVALKGFNALPEDVIEIEQIRKEISKLEQQREVLQKQAVPDSETLEYLRQKYLMSVKASCEWVDFRGILRTRAIQLHLSEIYVPLLAKPESVSNDIIQLQRSETEEDRLSQQIANEESDVKRQQLQGRLARLLTRVAYERQRWQSTKILEVWREHPRLVVLGDPGAGKTTLLKFLVLTLIESQQKPRNSQGTDTNLFPILLSIASYADKRRDDPSLTLKDYLPQYFRERDLPDMSKLFQQELAKGRCLVLIDGLDEVSNTIERLEVVKRIENLINAYSQNRFIITSRIVGYADTPLVGDYAHYTLEPLQPFQIEEFARRWCNTYLSQIGESSDPSGQSGAKAETLVESIRSNRSLQRLAANPLLLSLVTLIHLEGTPLPSHRIELYSRCVKTLTETWNQARSLAQKRVGQEFDEEAANILPALALWMHESKAGRVQRVELEERIANLLEAQRISPQDARATAKNFLDMVSQQTGILLERGEDNYEFLHLTFEEFLAALAIARSGSEERIACIKKHLHDPRWREVIPLSVSQIGIIQRQKDTASDLVQAIWKMKSRYESYLHRDLLMACRCLADDVGVEDALGQQILVELMDLWRSTTFRHLRNEAGEILASMRGSPYEERVISNLLEFLQYEKEKELKFGAEEATYDFAAGIGSREGAPQRPEEVRELIAQIAEILGKLGSGQPAIIYALKLLLADDNEYVRIRAAEALGRLSRCSQDALFALEDSLKSVVPVVRLAGVVGLKYAGTDSDKFISLLIELAEFAEHEVREEAILALGQVSKAREDVIQLLCRVLNGEDMGLAGRAAIALGHLSRSSEKALELLLSALRPMQEMRVQMVAAEALGKVSTPSADLVARLIDVAMSSTSSEVRSSAVESLGRLGKFFANVNRVLILLLRNKPGDSRVRASAAVALGRIRPTTQRVTTALCDALHDDDWSIRRNAIEALGSLKQSSPSVIDTLLAEMSDPDYDVRASVCMTLGQLGNASPSVLNALRKALREDIWQVRKNAALALGQLDEDSKDVEELLLNALRDDDRDVRSTAAIVIGQLRKPSEHIIEALFRLLWQGRVYQSEEIDDSMIQEKDVIFDALWSSLESSEIGI